MTAMDLLLPVLAATLAVFLVSSLLWMISPHHRKDVRSPPEDLERRVGELGIEPGFYMFPMGMDCDPQAMKDPAMRDRLERGPWGTLCVWPSAPKFGKSLGLTLLVYFVITVFVAYLGSQTLPRGAAAVEVFQITGTAALLGYAFGGLPGDIFFRKPARFVMTGLLDAIVMALVTGAVFAWLWPEAAIAPPSDATPDLSPPAMP